MDTPGLIKELKKGAGYLNVFQHPGDCTSFPQGVPEDFFPFTEFVKAKGSQPCYYYPDYSKIYEFFSQKFPGKIQNKFPRNSAFIYLDARGDEALLYSGGDSFREGYGSGLRLGLYYFCLRHWSPVLKGVFDFMKQEPSFINSVVSDLFGFQWQGRFKGKNKSILEEANFLLGRKDEYKRQGLFRRKKLVTSVFKIPVVL